MRRRLPSLRVARYEARSLRLSLVVVCVIGAVVSAGLCVELFLRSRYFVAYDYQPTLADYVAFVMAGVSQPTPSSGVVEVQHTLRIPFGWLALVLLPSVWVLLVAEVRGGDAALVACGDRTSYWLGKCTVALLGCVAVWLCVAAPCALFALSGHAGLGLVASDALPDVAGFAHETLALPPYDMVALVWEVPLVSCAVSLAQLLLSLAVDARLSFVVVAAQFAGSLYVMTPLIPGNLMSVARSLVFVVPYQVEVQRGLTQAGIDPSLGIAIAGVLGVASIVCGALLAHHAILFGGALK